MNSLDIQEMFFHHKPDEYVSTNHLSHLIAVTFFIRSLALFVMNRFFSSVREGCSSRHSLTSQEKLCWDAEHQASLDRGCAGWSDFLVCGLRSIRP